ncbi:VOC family protein [Nonomuraea sp. NPDC049152]|uniref:VOC family protein n=1 Tax=Nonomuraea sp. NPDC049152 TaxID=3154350 RepID=UPI0034080313
MTTNTAALAEISTLVIDSVRPAALAEFYRGVLGGQITHSDDDYAALDAGSVQLAFPRTEDYQAPAWPGGTKQVHLDLKVSHLDAAEKELLGLGATKPDFQPGGGDWVVLADPEGHLFCIAS